MLNITHYQRNASQNHNGVPSHASQNGCYQKVYKHKCQKGCREKGTLLHCWWECKLAQPLWKAVWRVLRKLEIEMPYDPATLLLGIHTEETRIERDTCTTMFITSLFTIARTGKLHDVHWQINGQESSGTYTQWNITQPLKIKQLKQF